MARARASDAPAGPAYPPALMGEEAAAAYVGISRPFLRELVAAGEAPSPVRLRTRRLYRRADLDAWAMSLPAERDEMEAEACRRAEEVYG